MNAVVAAIAFGMFGLFLPLTIFLQSTRPQRTAGLAFAPMSLVSMFVAPFAGRFADCRRQVNPFAGLLLRTTHVDSWSSRPAIRPDGACCPPAHCSSGSHDVRAAQTIAMSTSSRRSPAPSDHQHATTCLPARPPSELSCSAAGHQLPESAKENAAALPPSSATSSWRVQQRGIQRPSRGQTGVQLPAGIPEQVKPTILEAATKTFHGGYVTAMHYTLLLPLCVLAFAVLLVLFVRRQPSSAGGAEPSAAAASASQAA
jgi:hypothetical protein